MNAWRRLTLSCLALAVCLVPAWTVNASPQSQNLPVANAATSGASLPYANKPSAKAGVEPLIGSGDLLKISAFNYQDFDQETRVSSSGEISLPLINQVHVAGLTVSEAERLIEKDLVDRGFIKSPHISVLEKEYATQGVSVLGEVLKPGVYPLLGDRRLFDILSLAGGTTPRAGKIITIAHRDYPDRPVQVSLSNNSDRSVEGNVPVLPGDTIVVSKEGIVYVVGDVHKPSGIVMENGTNLTVLQAIAMAEGTNPDAALNRSKLIRRTPQGPQELPLALKKILSAKMADPVLQPEDIIFVPGSIEKGAARRGLEAILQTTTGILIYRHP